MGYNCEVAYKLYKYYHYEESSLFNWAYSKGIESIISLLRNPELIYNGDFTLRNDDMWELNNPEIAFHGKIFKYDEITINQDKKDLTERVKYLTDKVFKILRDDSKKLYIYKIHKEEADENILEKIYTLEKTLTEAGGKNFRLMIVSEISDQEYFIKSDKYIYRTVKEYPKDNDVLNNKYKKNGFFEIFDEIWIKKPLFYFKKKKYKFDKKQQTIKITDKKYDLIFSIGQACSCSMLLRKLGLQFSSYPFDWVYGSTLIGRCEIINDDFKNYINKEDLINTGKNNGVLKHPCQIYENSKNKIGFNHDFEVNVPFDIEYEKVKAKYERRSTRLLSRINESENVLVVYLQVPNCTDIISDEDLITAQEILANKFSATNIDLLYVNACKKYGLRKENVNNNIIKVSFDYDAYNKEVPYAVNVKELKKQLKSLKITNKYKNIFDLRNWKFLKNIFKRIKL
ncbi:MAG: papain-like cysteine peptidase [bacterium]|nr:papain-like cysteine peptidase [bacterium]